MLAQRADIDALSGRIARSTGEDAVLLERRRMRKVLAALADLERFVENALQLEEERAPVDDLRVAAESMLRFAGAALRERIDALRAERADLGRDRDAAAGEERNDLEDRLAEIDAMLDELLSAELDTAENLERLGLDAAEARAYIERALTDRAEMASARIEYALERVELYAARLEDSPDDAELAARLAAAGRKRDRSMDNLAATVALMERMELEAADYHKLLVRSSGSITADLLDQEVALSLVEEWAVEARAWIVERGPEVAFKAVVFVAILVVFWLLARVVRRVVGRAVRSSRLHFSQLLQDMVVKIVGNAVLLIGLLVGLSQLGFSLGPILAGLGIAGFIIGFALQDTLGNFAAGTMILLYRPFDVGDIVDAGGVFGKVSAMSMVSTTVLTFDNQTLIVPNSKIWGDVIKNVTAQTTRRVDLTFGISYADDISRAEKVLEDIVRAHDKVLDDPAPIVKLHTLGESSVDFVVRPWVATADYWDVYWDVTREVKLRFDREGISIPFPQRDVHLHGAPAAAAE